MSLNRYAVRIRDSLNTKWKQNGHMNSFGEIDLEVGSKLCIPPEINLCYLTESGVKSPPILMYIYIYPQLIFLRHT